MYRSAVPANALYLAQYQKNNQDRLLKNEPNGPEIVGCVYKHPSAIIDPSAKVSKRSSPLFISQNVYSSGRSFYLLRPFFFFFYTDWA